MGISTNFYTVFGLKLPFKKDFFEKADKNHGDDNAPFVLQDGMCGSYTICGIVLFDSGDLRWGFENGDEFKEIPSVQELSLLEQNYKTNFYKYYPEIYPEIDKPFKLMTFAHYS